MTKQEMWEKFRQFDFNRIVIIASIAIVAVALWGNYEKSQKIKTAYALNKALNDTVTFWKTEEGFHKARISVLEAYSTRDFTELSSKDTIINKLQKLVEENKNSIKKQGSITIIQSETKIDTTTKSIVNNNTKVQPDGKSPIYSSKINLGKWVTGEIVAGRDSISTKLSFKQEMDLVIGREKTGFLGLGKGKTFVEATLHNPYSEIKTIRTYQTTLPPTKKIHIGPTLMYGIGQDVRPGAYIGIGVTWGVINF